MNFKSIIFKYFRIDDGRKGCVSCEFSQKVILTYSLKSAAILPISLFLYGILKSLTIDELGAKLR